MNKISFLFFAFLIAVTSFSCKKDYTCTCITSSSNSAGVTIRSYLDKTIKDTKKNAKATCDGFNVKSVTTCELK